MAWTDEMVEDLKRMWKEGLTTGEIGKRLNVSKNSIVGKVHRLGLSGRPSPIKKKNETTKETKVTKTKPTKAASSEPQSIEKKAPIVEKETKLSNVPAPESKKDKKEMPFHATPVKMPTQTSNRPHNLSLTELDNHTCRWPIGDPKDANFHFCGKKVRLGQTYCEEHSTIAYVKPGKK